MTSKTEQLLLELYLLRSRYSAVDIERVSRLQEAQREPLLRSLISTLAELQAKRKSKHTVSTRTKETNFLIKGDFGDTKIIIRSFIDRLSTRKILRNREQIDNFAQSIGVHGNFAERRELIAAIREKLETLPATQVIQKISSVGGRPSSDSRPYVELAKTLMRS
jgi:hypothetical protein